MIKLFRGVAQMVACMVRDHEAAGSSPATPTKSTASACTCGAIFIFCVIRAGAITLRFEMKKMEENQLKMTTKKIAQATIVGAAYAALTAVLAPIS